MKFDPDAYERKLRDLGFTENSIAVEIDGMECEIDEIGALSLTIKHGKELLIYRHSTDEFIRKSKDKQERISPEQYSLHEEMFANSFERFFTKLKKRVEATVALQDRDLKKLKALSKETSGFKHDTYGEGYNILHLSALLPDVDENFLTELTKICDPELINGKDFVGKTPLHLAAQQNRADLCSAMLKANASIIVVDDLYRMPFNCAGNEAREFLLKVTRLALSKTTASTYDDDSPEKMFLSAAKKKDALVCFLLLACGVDPNQSEEDGTTVFHYATAIKDNNGIVLCKTLINRGISCDSRNSSGEGALEAALRNRNFAVFEILCKDYPKQINARGRNGNGIIQFFIEAGDAEIVEFLLKNGANHRVVNDAGEDAMAMCKRMQKNLPSQDGEEAESLRKMIDLLEKIPKQRIEAAAARQLSRRSYREAARETD